ncbi:MAG: hypothetical protein AAB521_04065 [Patescibacteria group bacterium]
MRKIKNFLPALFLSLLSLGILIYLVFNQTPNSEFTFGGIHLGMSYIFLALLFVFIFGISSFVLKNFRRGAFIGAFVALYLVLRILNLTHVFFFLILLALFISLDLFFVYNK